MGWRRPFSPRLRTLTWNFAPTLSAKSFARVGDVEVLAVGTAFSVQLDSEAVDVHVTEGRVRVGAEAAKDRPVAYVGKGRRCVVAAANLTPKVETMSLPMPANGSRGACRSWNSPAHRSARSWT